MVKITKSYSIEIEKDGNRITFSPDEIEEIKRQLDAAIRERGKRAMKQKEGGGRATTTAAAVGRGRSSRGAKQQQRGIRRTKKSATAPSSSLVTRKAVHMSDDKKREIMDNVGKKLSPETPKTLSALLDGVSYVPNYLPAIRKIVEDRDDVAKIQVGKRTLYLLKK